MGSLAPSRPRVMLTHGEDLQRHAMRKEIKSRFGLDAEVPNYRQVITC
jgi:hypothetical protein